MPVKQTTPPEAHTAMQGGRPYVDVRTPEEFAAGHPAGSVNVPILLRAAPGGPMQPNPEFLQVMEAHFAKETPLLLGCQSGGRSQRAGELMAQAGWQDVTNVDGGFGGRRDPSGQAHVPGWREAGLPVEQEVTEANSYEALRRKAVGG